MQTQYFKRAEGALAYSDYGGDGQLVLMLPGMGAAQRMLIEHLDASSAHVIGTSFSPSAAAWAAAERPDRVRSLALISPFVREAKINPMMKALRNARENRTDDNEFSQ